MTGLAPDGAVIPFADGHTRQLPRLTEGPFRYATYADTYLREAAKRTGTPIKQAVIAPSALSLLYPEDGIDGYPREMFLSDLIAESASDVRRCLDAGADSVQLDFHRGPSCAETGPQQGFAAQFRRAQQRGARPVHR